jgi:deazaflavin-dependent oxidoreductase (nitroreductase family)
MKKHGFFMQVFHQFLALRPISWLMARILHRADAFLLRLSGGRMTFAQLTGLPIIEVTTIGAKSGKQRTLPLTGLPDGDKYALIASNFGQAHHPGWYYNLKANPECIVRKDGHSGTYIAREADESESKYYYDMAISYHIAYAAYKQRAAHRQIPVMVLEPKPQINTDERQLFRYAAGSEIRQEQEN